MDELNELINELVAKAGPKAGQIKVNQDPEKVARLKELGWKQEEKITIEKRLSNIEEMLIDHEARIKECSIRR